MTFTALHHDGGGCCQLKLRLTVKIRTQSNSGPPVGLASMASMHTEDDVKMEVDQPKTDEKI